MNPVESTRTINFRYPKELPITQHRAEIVRAIKNNRVVIICGETGCGKSTQIPKMCIEAGRASFGLIGCTQPRRIAAVTIAHRIAEEMGQALGATVGYKIRFQDKTSPTTLIKIMTDGMLLAETQSDPRLDAYVTLIVDEAHERSLNIDFLLGIARTLLPRRRDLRLVITSATLDVETFSNAFPGAPVLEVGGRLFPVEVEYLPPESFPGADEDDYVDLAVRAVERLRSRRLAGDILIFMPTEQDILETCERLEGKRAGGAAVLPLYARLPAAQQGRVYSVTGPKIVVATNVAETSLTIPGIRFVIDTGLARIAQYQPGTRINSLPISPVSQSSADQRKGRCGRVSAGHCIRLYSQDDYEARPRFTPPEILRSNLAEVILRMIDLRLGSPLEFPFVDRPQARAVKDGYEELGELGAIEGQGREARLTDLGRRMARMPLDPRISRMLLEASEEGCLRETAVIAAVLSIRDPRERPPDQAEAADAAQLTFRHPDSDFLTMLNIWDRFHEGGDGSAGSVGMAAETSGAGTASRGAGATSRSRAKRPSWTKLKRFCNEHFLSFVRMREWIFVHDQILTIVEELRIPAGRRHRAEMTPDLYGRIHRSILSGFLSQFAVHKEKSFYTAAKGREVMVFPGSALFGKAKPWIVAAEVVRTSQLFARTAAKIDPDWLERLGGPLCKVTHSEPRWDEERGEVKATEKVSLFGIEIVSGRDVPYGPVDPDEASAIFVREALVAGRVKEPQPAFLKHNLELVRKVAGMEEKMRRRDILADEEDQAAFYEARLASVFDMRGLAQRIRKTGGGDAFLRMSEKDLVRERPDEGELRQFPDELTVEGRRLRTSYRFAPGEKDDGVTLKVPAGLIERLPAEPLSWGVPGQYKERITALIRGLPKRYRKLLVPAPEKAEVIVKEMEAAGPSLYETLARFVKERFRVEIPAGEWEKADVPDHLRVRIAVTDHEGKEIAASRDIEALRKAGRGVVLPEDSDEWRRARAAWERERIEGFDIGDLPETVMAGHYTTAYPGLEAAEGATASGPSVGVVNIKLFRSRVEALASHLNAIEALLQPKFAKDLEFVKLYLALPDEPKAAYLPFGGKAALEKKMHERLRVEVFRKNIRSGDELRAYEGTVVKTLFDKGHQLRERVLEIIEARDKLRRTLVKVEGAGKLGPVVKAILAGIRAEAEALVLEDFIGQYGIDRLGHLPRYLEALAVRAERAVQGPEKDRAKAEQVAPFVQALERVRKGLKASDPPEKAEAIEELRWLVEEFKVALFAPELKTAVPVSAKRLLAKLKSIEV
jgi:ATP-dependent helicase HrpA